eukprot:gene22467-27113_t
MKTLNALMSNTKERDSLRRAHAQTQSRLSKKIPFLHSKSNVQRYQSQQPSTQVQAKFQAMQNEHGPDLTNMLTK